MFYITLLLLYLTKIKGFSVDGQENIQEILSKQLYLCQFLTALSVLRVGGNFVCKLFDIFTPFSVGLIYLMYLCFDRICIHKPVTSRPANSERYIICESANSNKTIIVDYLTQVNDSLNETFRDETSDLDVVSIVPLNILKSIFIFMITLIFRSIYFSQPNFLYYVKF
jgi:cap1 methyltransferase